MTRSSIAKVFNQGFRFGANAREASGLKPGKHPEPSETPVSPLEIVISLEIRAWKKGWAMGYATGASDRELASVDEPGAHGMIREMSEGMLEMMGVLRQLAE